jgi:NACalpha-BTF3-like transcription factor
VSDKKKKTIHRVEKSKNYSVICNSGPHDDRLTWGARGLLTYMLTMPDDWDFYNEELAKHSPESIRVVKRLISELKEFGYVKRVPVKDEKTHRIIRWETVLYETAKEPDEDQEADGEKKEEDEESQKDEKPEGENRTSGTNVENTPEARIPPSGIPGGVESHHVENVPLLSTNVIENTNGQKLPNREQQAAPEEPEGSVNVPDMQKATAVLFLKIGGKQQLSDDDRSCLKMLYKIHTPAAIQKQMLDSFDRLKKNGHVKVEFEGKEYVIQDPAKLPIRYIYNSMKNWTSLKNAGKGGKNNGASRGNPARSSKNYTGKAPKGFFA